MPPLPSFYFTLFKKFQVVNHVPAGSAHGSGSPSGGYDLKNPAATFGSSNRGALLGASTTPSDSPLWAVLNAKAMGLASVVVGGTTWPAMPVFATPAWNDFQLSAPAPKLVQTFADWITAGKINDIPNGVLATRPPTLTTGLDAGVELFVCSMPGDDGIRPGAVPANYWATSLIFLVDPATGNIATPTELAGSSEYFLTAAIGNRGNAPAGQYISGGIVSEAAGWVMVWNSGMSPAVQLPSLSNLDVNSTNGVYNIYFLRAGNYDVVGFRLNVQTVFDGLVAAITASGMDLGGLTPAQWVHAQGAHLCAKVLVRKAGESWPALGDTPITNRRLAQKNLAPFAVDVAVVDPNPNIIWKNFVVGDVIQRIAGKGFDDRMGVHTLTIEGKLVDGFTRLLLAIPERSFKRWFNEDRLRGLKLLNEKEAKAARPPFPECVVLAFPADARSFEVPPLGEEFLALSIGAEYNPKRLKPGRLGDLTVVQKTAAPRVDPQKGRFTLEQVTVGGFTVRFEAYDSRELLNPKWRFKE